MANIIPTGRDLLNDDFFGGMFGKMWKDRSFDVDVKETEDEYAVHADLPGFTKEDIRVEYDNQVLTISAAHIENKEDTTGEYIRKERSTMSQHRQFVLKNVDEDKINAAYKDGVLTIDLPKYKKDKADKKKITIN